MYEQVADFWLLPSTVNDTSHVMASPNSPLEELLTKWNITYDIMLDDLEKFVHIF